jgi:hypothetical protein
MISRILCLKLQVAPQRVSTNKQAAKKIHLYRTPPQAVDAGSLLYTIHRDHNGNVLGTGVHLMAVTGGGNGSVVVLEDRRFDHCTFDPWELHYSGDLEQELVQGDEFPHGL